MSDITETQESKSTQKIIAERVPGQTMLPLARIKRVIKEDKDVSLINAEATFCIAYATELFMEYLVKEAFTKAKKEKRKTVYYRDLAGTVKEIEQFEFLEDVIPTTMTLKQAIEKRKETNTSEESTPSKKQKKSNNNEEEETPIAEEEIAAEEEEEEEEEEVNQQDDDEDMDEPKAE